MFLLSDVCSARKSIIQVTINLDFINPLTILLVFFCSFPTHAQEELDPPEVALGERLFKEARFSWWFYSHSSDDINRPLPGGGDPSLDFVSIDGRLEKSPFRGQTYSCASCHMVDQAQEIGIGGMRLYNDYSAFTPVTRRGPIPEWTLRNSPQLVMPKPPIGTPLIFHHDGEFIDLKKLTISGWSGRNFGWLADESLSALDFIAKVIREDNGTNPLAIEFGGYSYSQIFLSDPQVVDQAWRLPKELRLSISEASDQNIRTAAARLVEIYLQDLNFETNEDGNYLSSPYDYFLRANSLPQGPYDNESVQQYTERLRGAISTLQNPEFISETDHSFETHSQPFRFGPQELRGLKLFLGLDSHKKRSSCVACHTPPHFTDFGFHNNAIARADYESVHGRNSFANLQVVSLDQRSIYENLYGIPNPEAPNRLRLLSSQPKLSDPRRADLGLWSLFANADFSSNQEVYLKVLQNTYFDQKVEQLNQQEALDLTIGLFKTPSLRNLGHSNPYFHNGQATTIDEVLDHYLWLSGLVKEGKLISPSSQKDPKLRGFTIDSREKEAFKAFLTSLNEDYD